MNGLSLVTLAAESPPFSSMQRLAGECLWVGQRIMQKGPVYSLIVYQYTYYRNKPTHATPTQSLYLIPGLIIASKLRWWWTVVGSGDGGGGGVEDSVQTL